MPGVMQRRQGIIDFPFEYFSFIFSLFAASYPNSQGTQNDDDPNNTTVSNLFQNQTTGYPLKNS